jgi:3-hydroxyisobutyrate dehydrogenase
MRYAIAGLGPVGRRIGTRAAELGHDVVWYDPDPEVRAPLQRVDSILEATAGADRLVSAVPARAAASVLAEAAPAFSGRLIFEDWSSAAPEDKRRLGDAAGAAYVDVTLLDSITASDPLLCLAGQAAEVVASELADLGFEAMVAGRTPGEAAVVKMVRSSFMKPFEALTIELLLTSARWDPAGAAIASITRTLRDDFGDVARMLIETNRLHAARRAGELKTVMDSVGLPSGRGLLAASHSYLDALGTTWTRPGAPPAGAGMAELVAFLAAEGDE